MTIVGYDVFNLNPVFPSASFRTEGNERFSVSGWSGPCSNLWWSIGDYASSTFTENHLAAMQQCGLTAEDIYQSWNDYRAGGGMGGQGDRSKTASNGTGNGNGNGGCSEDTECESGETCVSGECIADSETGFLDTLTSPLAIGVGVLALAGIGYFMFFRK